MNKEEFILNLIMLGFVYNTSSNYAYYDLYSISGIEENVMVSKLRPLSDTLDSTDDRPYDIAYKTILKELDKYDQR